MKKTVSVLLIIGVVALGAMHGHYTFLHSNNRISDNVGFFAYLLGNYKEGKTTVAQGAGEAPDSGPVQRERGREAPAAKPKPTERPGIAVEKTKPPKPVVDTAKVAGLIRNGRELYQKSEYEQARKLFEEAVAILSGADRKSHPGYKEAENLSKRCLVFDALVNNIPYLELSGGQDLFAIELETGATIVAKVLKDDGDNVTIQQNDGIQSTLSYDQIDKINPISPADYRGRLLKDFRDRLSKADKKAYFDVFGLALFAIQNQLRNEITTVLEHTFELPGSELVLQTFYTGDNAEKLVIALLESFDKTEEAKKYLIASRPAPPPPPEPDPNPYEPPPEPDPGPEPDPVAQPQRPVTSAPPGSKRARFDEAGLYFATGQKLANLAVNHPAKRSVYGKKAHVELGKSRDILNVLQDQYPDDREIENMLQQVSDLLHFVIHNLVGI